MAYSDSFPATRPVFMADFANGGKIDPRASYSRSTTGTYFGTAKHLSSENLLLQSSDFDTTWSKQGLEVPTGGQADPAGGTDGFTLEETSGANFHHIWQLPSVTGSLALTVYAKQNSGTRYVYLTIWNAVNDWQIALFDLAGNPPATANGSASTFTGVTATQTASGNGYYKCTLRATGTASVTYIGLDDSSTVTGYSTGYGVKSYTGDGTSSIDVAFASLSTIGASDYNATTTQIHREYAPTLQTAAINAARFEHSAADGESMGVLIEGSSTNAVSYSDSISNWNEARLTVTDNAAVGPTGSLNASLLTPTSANGTHSTNLSSVATNVTGTVTLSGYFKAAGYDYVTLGIGDTTTTQFAHALFNLSTGAYVANNVSGNSSYVSSSTESVGNGWWRLVATFSTTEANEKFVVSPASSASPSYNANWGVPTYAGDDYSGVLAVGLQGEVGKSFASSLITSNSGAETTRTSDSLSMVDSNLFDNGEGTIVAEYDMFAASETSYVAHLHKSSGGTNGDGVAITNRYVYVEDNFLDAGNLSSNTFHKVAASWEPSSQKISRNGGAAAENTSTVVPSGIDKLYIGQRQDGGEPVNGHIKRLAIYSEPLSSTHLQSLTK